MDQLKTLALMRTEIFYQLATIFIKTPQVSDIRLLVSLLEKITDEYSYSISSSLTDGIDEFNDIFYEMPYGCDYDMQLVINKEAEKLFGNSNYSVITDGCFYNTDCNISQINFITDLTNFYLSNNFQYQKYYYLNIDSLALQLLFFSSISNQQCLCNNKNRYFKLINVQIDFYEKYLHMWGKFFADTLYVAADDTGVFRSITKLLSGYLLLDYRIIKSLK